MTKQEEKRLVEIQGMISKLQEPLAQCEQAMNNPDNDYEEKQYAKRQVKDIKRIIGDYEAEREFIIIKKYLSEEGVNFDKYPSDDDLKRIEMLRSGDKTYLEYQIDYRKFDDTKRRIMDEEYIETLRGVVIFNSKYEILYNKSEFVDYTTDKTGFARHTSDPRFRDNTIDRDFVFNGENDLIIDMQARGSSYTKIYHFKKQKDGKYEIVHTFTNKDRKCKVIVSEREVNIVTDVNGKKFAEYYGRLYDIENGTYYDDVAFDEIFDSYSEKLPSFGCGSEEQIRQIMKRNNVFLGHISTFSAFLNDLNYVDIYGYIDTKGRLVSDLIYHQQQTAKTIYPTLFNIEVDNKTYYETIEKIKENNNELVLQLKAEERRKEEERRREEERKYRAAQLREQRIRAGRLAFITKVVPKKLNLTLDEKKEQS